MHGVRGGVPFSVFRNFPHDLSHVLIACAVEPCQREDVDMDVSVECERAEDGDGELISLRVGQG